MKLLIQAKAYIASAKGDVLVYPGAVVEMGRELPQCMNPLPRWATVVDDDTPENPGDRNNPDLGAQMIAESMATGVFANLAAAGAPR